MKLANETITIFNRILDTETDTDVYIPTVIKGVSWYSDFTATVGNNGLNGASKVTVRIPGDAECDKAYVEPMNYTAGNTGSAYTLIPGDIIVRAEIPSSDSTPAELKEAYRGRCMTVLNVTDDRRAPKAPHIKIVGSG